MFSITKKRATQHYRRKAREKYKFKFNDTGGLQRISLEVFEADEDGELFETPNNRVTQRDDVDLDDVPFEILDFASETLLTAEEEI